MIKLFTKVFGVPFRDSALYGITNGNTSGITRGSNAKKISKLITTCKVELWRQPRTARHIEKNSCAL
jgi:hypothetical protein